MARRVSFRAPRGLDPEAIAELFSQFGTVERVLRQYTTTSVAWEKAKSTVPTFPEVAVEIKDNLPVEVAVIGSFSPGEGEQFYRRSTALQKAHATFVDEYNEASAKLANADFSKNDPTTVYSFSVGKQDLVFHRHEGHRAITGITGAAGAVLKFSGASPQEADSDPEAFVDKMFIIEVPPDSLFILRFHGTVYHQFGSADPNKDAFFAISVHTNEAGGLSGELLEVVKAGNASIPLLTEPIHDNVAQLLDRKDFSKMTVKTRKKRTVSATKRYMLRLKKKEEAAKEGEDKNVGNHLFPAEPLPSNVQQLLDITDLKKRVPVFSLPRLITSVADPLDTFHVEFDSVEAVKRAISAQQLQIHGYGLELEVKWS
jgi:hypothetical protein